MYDKLSYFAACYVLCASANPTVIGYYTLSATSVEITSLPPALAKRSGRYQTVPAALLGRLAVDSRFAGQKLGTDLMLNAMRRTLRTGIGIKAIVVDALDQRATAFYEQFGFARVEDNPLRLCLSLSAIREVFAGEQDEPSSE